MPAEVDIDLAVQVTLRALTLSEKSLAHDLLHSKQFHETSGIVWLRAPSFNLDQAIRIGRAGPNGADGAATGKFSLRTLYIHCDTLVIEPGTPIDSENHILTIEIFARRIIGSSLTFDTIPGCSISFGTPHLPHDFEVTINGKVEKPVVDTENGSFGIMLSHEDNAEEPVQVQLPAPDAFMDTINWLQYINEDGSVRPKGMGNDDVPRLLQMQLLVAQAHARTNPNFSIALLNYVIAATADPSSLQLNYQAASLRNALVLQSDVMAVPSVNIYASKQVLKARLAAAMAFEVSFQSFSAQSHVEGNRTSDALDMLAKSDDAISAYKFTLGIRQREFDNAVTANNKAAATFAQNEKDIDSLRKAFEKGIEDYKDAQKMEAVKGVITGIFSVVVAVAATVATAGAAAPAVVGAIGAVAQGATEVVTLWQKLKAVFDKIKAIYEKIKPVIAKLQELVKTAMAVVAALRQLAQTTGAADSAVTVKADAQSPDIFNATAEWRRFNLTVMEMEEILRDYDIDGKADFFHALKTLVINGECYIQTQANLVTKGDELATVMLQSKHEDRQHERLSKLAYKSTTDSSVFELLRRAMFDRLLAIRALVYLDFATYLSAYDYHTMLRENVISLSPVKPIVDYLEDAARLQAAVVSYGARVLVQSRKFFIHSFGDGLDTSDELVTRLRSNGTVKVTVDPTDDMWTGFTRIRMSTVRCYLDGVKSKSNIRLRMHTDGNFFDRDFTTLSSDRKILTRSFLGDARTILFEYRAENGEPVVDGQYGREREYTKHTPMTSWEIKLMGWDQLEELGLDLNGVNSVVLKFECDVVYVDE